MANEMTLTYQSRLPLNEKAEAILQDYTTETDRFGNPLEKKTLS